MQKKDFLVFTTDILDPVASKYHIFLQPARKRDPSTVSTLKRTQRH